MVFERLLLCGRWAPGELANRIVLDKQSLLMKIQIIKQFLISICNKYFIFDYSAISIFIIPETFLNIDNYFPTLRKVQYLSVQLSTLFRCGQRRTFNDHQQLRLTVMYYKFRAFCSVTYQHIYWNQAQNVLLSGRQFVGASFLVVRSFVDILRYRFKIHIFDIYIY